MSNIRIYRWITVSLLSAASCALDAAPHHATPAVEDAPQPHHEAACTPQRLEPTTPGGITYFRDCPDSPVLVAFRGGNSRMGDLLGNGLPYEKPVHMTHISPFALGRFEVTNVEWEACVIAHGCSPIGGSNLTKLGNHPVEGVSWDDAQQYLAWLSRHTGKTYRLPSEAEWEYAARAGTSDQFTWGNNVSDVCQYANSLDESGNRELPQLFWFSQCDDGFAKTSPVGSYPPNSWGLYDMLGNVWEWTQDCWHSDYTNAPADGSAWMAEGNGDCRKHVNRGGGWGNHARSLRVSNRDGDGHADRSDALGFRVARTVAPIADVVSSPTTPSQAVPNPPAAKAP